MKIAESSKRCIVIALMTTSPQTRAAATETSPFLPIKIVGGGENTCVLSTQGQIKCWGFNESGELGVGTSIKHGLYSETMGKNLPTVNLGNGIYAQNICAGNNFTCAVTTTGAVKCWGANYRGQLGQEHDIGTVGLLAAQMGENLPRTDLGVDFVAKDIQCGTEFACALSSQGKVKCWGYGDDGQLGIALTNRTNVGRRKDEMGAKLPYLSLPTPVTQITTGYSHACAVAGDNIYCWGGNNFGQTGLELATSSVYLPTDETLPKPIVKLEDAATSVTIESVQAGGNFTCAEYRASENGLPARRKIKCWGKNSVGQLGLGVKTEMIGRLPGSMGTKLPEVILGISDISQIQTYHQHTCAATNRGDVKCWGRNVDGQLGLGDRINRGETTGQMGPNLPFVDLGLPVVSISSGSYANTTCAILINHEIKCWGDGSSGALGYENDLNRGDDGNQMGDILPYVNFK